MGAVGDGDGVEELARPGTTASAWPTTRLGYSIPAGRLSSCCNWGSWVFPVAILRPLGQGNTRQTDSTTTSKHLSILVSCWLWSGRHEMRCGTELSTTLCDATLLTALGGDCLISGHCCCTDDQGSPADPAEQTFRHAAMGDNTPKNMQLPSRSTPFPRHCISLLIRCPLHTTILLMTLGHITVTTHHLTQPDRSRGRPQQWAHLNITPLTRFSHTLIRYPLS